MVKEELVLPEDVGSYAAGVVELEVMVGGRVLESAFNTTEDKASGGTTACDTTSLVALAVDVTDEDIGDELGALEVVLCGDCDVASSLLDMFTVVAEFEVDDGREDDRKCMDEGETGLFDESETETVVCLK